ncbi:hypothetical protein KIW84_015911 [Lathyrus oleraceus]|uniref:Uncharacterized protein n=1 Tax=Pisum sativum TaxID=3888 RepID=A0A9D5BRV7_PEA|nr:hypothetical protein KIW84_015911 [Pisum sativum]
MFETMPRDCLCVSPGLARALSFFKLIVISMANYFNHITNLKRFQNSMKIVMGNNLSFHFYLEWELCAGGDTAASKQCGEGCNITAVTTITFSVHVIISKVEESAFSSLKRAFEALNTHLAHNTYLVGDSVTLADIITTCNLWLGFSKILVKSFTSEFPHVERYFWTLVNQPNFRKIIGQVKQTEALPPIPSAQKPKESKPKTKDESKKVAKSEPVKPKVEEAEEEAPKPKAKNPLDLLPPSKMIG